MSRGKITLSAVVLAVVGFILYLCCGAEKLHAQFMTEQRQPRTGKELADYNDKNEKKFKQMIARAADVLPQANKKFVNDGLCGPAAIYVSSDKFGIGAKGFSNWVNKIVDSGHYSSLVGFGQNPSDVVAALSSEGISSTKFHGVSLREAYEKAILAFDEGRSVFIEVRSDETFKALTQDEHVKELPQIKGAQHWILLAAVQRDDTGAVKRVGYFDVNVYSGQPVAKLQQEPKYVTPDIFKSFNHITWTNLLPAIVITDKPISS